MSNRNALNERILAAANQAAGCLTQALEDRGEDLPLRDLALAVRYLVAALPPDAGREDNEERLQRVLAKLAGINEERM